MLQATASLEDPDWTEVPGGASTPLAGPIPCNEVAVDHGLFAVTLDFGDGVFTGDQRWLEIGVRSSRIEEPFVTLTPRQPLLPVPYALHAQQAGTVPDGSIAGPKPASGQVVRSLKDLTDDVLLIWGATIPRIVAGWRGNSVAGEGATVGGGGGDGIPNRAVQRYATVGGGFASRPMALMKPRAGASNWPSSGARLIDPSLLLCVFALIPVAPPSRNLTALQRHETTLPA